MPDNYFFTSHRLGFRNWRDSDIPVVAEMNADPEVMKFFPGLKSYKESAAFVARMQNQFNEKAYCYFAVDKLDDGEFIGFIGLSDQTYKASFTPCVDIGWRLSRNAWGNGYATEGAKACLGYAFDVLNMKEIYSVAPIINLPSIAVMEKIGMEKMEEFAHPLLLDDERLRECVVYVIHNEV